MKLSKAALLGLALLGAATVASAQNVLEMLYQPFGDL